jgi:hypothetical protein
MGSEAALFLRHQSFENDQRLVSFFKISCLHIFTLTRTIRRIILILQAGTPPLIDLVKHPPDRPIIHNTGQPKTNMQTLVLLAAFLSFLGVVTGQQCAANNCTAPNCIPCDRPPMNITGSLTNLGASFGIGPTDYLSSK